MKPAARGDEGGRDARPTGGVDSDGGRDARPPDGEPHGAGQTLVERVSAHLTQRFLIRQLGECAIDDRGEVVLLSPRGSTGELLRANLPVLSRAFTRALGRDVRVEVGEGTAPVPEGGKAEGPALDPASIPLVRQTLELFDGKIKGVVRRG